MLWRDMLKSNSEQWESYRITENPYSHYLKFSEVMSSLFDKAQTPSMNGTGSKGRKTRRIAALVVVALVVLGLIISFVPTFVARYIIATRLDGLGIEHEGVDTLSINPWKREVWVGPVRIHVGESDPGQLAEFGIKIGIFPLFRKHTMVESVLIRGIDIVVARTQDNTITLNGIPLSKFFRADESSETKPDKAKPWGVGLGDLELLDSHVIFKKKTGGTLTVEIDRLAMSNFLSWNPENPGTFKLNAHLNDIGFEWRGTARPFEENIMIEAEASIDNASLPKIIRFSGPIGFQRKGGTYNSRLKHKITLFASGRLEAQSAGKVEVIGLDYEREGKFSLSVDQSDIDLNTQLTLSEDGRLRIVGRALVTAANTQGSAGRDHSYGAESARVEASDLDLSVGAGKGFQLVAMPQITLENGKYSGNIEISVSGLLQILRFFHSISAGESNTSGLPALDTLAESKSTSPKTDLTVAQLSSRSRFGLKVVEGSVSLDIPSTVELSGLQLSSLERTTTVKMMRNDLKAFEIRTGKGLVSISMLGDTNLNGQQVKGPIGEASAESIETSIQKSELKIRPDKITFDFSGSASLNGTSFFVPGTKDVPQTSAKAETIMAKADQASLLMSKDKLGWETEGEAKVDQLAVTFDEGAGGFIKLASLELRRAKADQDLRIKTSALTVSALDLFVTRELLVGDVTKDEDNQAQNKDKDISETAKGTPSSMVKEIQQLLADLGYNPGPIDGRMGLQTQAAIRAFEEISGLPLLGLSTTELLAALREANAKPISLTLGRFALVDGAKISFRDNLVEPSFEVDTTFETVELLDVDMIDPSKRAQARVVGDLNEFTHLELEGWISALGPKPNLDMKAKIENLELHPYSPYTAEFGGFRLDSGQLTAFANATADQGNLTGNIELDLDHVDLASLTDEDKERLADKAGLPVETVIWLLEDKNGHIELMLPLTGKVTEPGVDLKPAIMKGIGGALKKVFPPTLIASMFSSGNARGLSFQPIKFEPGSDKLDEAGKSYADNLLVLLQEYPKLSLNVCGRVTAQDFVEKTGHPFKPPAASKDENAGAEQSRQDPDALKRIQLIEKYSPELNELAAERTRKVRSYLITEQGADPKRVAECVPKFDPDDLGPPRVEVTL